jgi:hydrogenase maturation protease
VRFILGYASAHLVLSTKQGEFVSLLDPTEEFRPYVIGCKNIGNFPVLLGNSGEHDTMLCSPIILYDYPQIAPESAGDFYDATEMDEMLTLRLMTLTDEEKNKCAQRVMVRVCCWSAQNRARESS